MEEIIQKVHIQQVISLITCRLRQQGKQLLREHNYVDVFEWSPDQKPTVFRTQAGNLLTKDTFKVLDYINNNPRPELELAINLMVVYRTNF